MADTEPTNDLNEGDEVEVPGSGSRMYTLKLSGGVYSCSCPAWQFQGRAIVHRTCKHLRAYRGDAAEEARLAAAGATATGQPIRKSGAAGSSPKKTPPLLLAHRWEQTDPTGWWMSEKLDGVRAYWDGTQFLSRQGNVYTAPSWFTEGLPQEGTFTLDGELWLDRKEFQQTVSIVRSHDKSDRWKKVTYMVFDAPSHEAKFEQRLEVIDAHFSKQQPSYAKLLAHEKCTSREHLAEELARIEGMGGEGVMLRKAGSSYQVGRSSTLLKVKTFKDTEGRVLKHLPGAGKHQGRLGALLLEMADGTRVSVGTGFSDAERESPPELGSIITFRYQELTKAGVPRFPSYVRPRPDLTELPTGPSDVAPIAAASKATKATPAKVPMAKSAAPKPNKAVAKPKPAAASAAASSGDCTTHLEADGRFWEVEQRGERLYIRFGAVGKSGQTRLKILESAADAEAQARKLVAQKQKKGFIEVTEG